MNQPITLMLPLPEHSLSTLDTVHCLDALTLLRGLPSNYIDMGLTSPPYDNLRTYNGYSWNFEAIARELYRVIKPGGVLVWVVGDATVNGSETLTSFKQALYFKEMCGFNLWQTIIWSRPGTHPNRQNRYPKMHEYCFILSKGNVKTFNPLTKPNKYAGEKKKHIKRQRNGKVMIYGANVVADDGWRSSVWEIAAGFMISTPDKCAYDHPATFPEALAKDHILTWSNSSDIVMDIFMGSGTTGKMAAKLGRHYIGCDISQEYVNLARRRIANADPMQASQVTEDTVQLSLFAGVD